LDAVGATKNVSFLGASSVFSAAAQRVIFQALCIVASNWIFENCCTLENIKNCFIPPLLILGIYDKTAKEQKLESRNSIVYFL
jgi:hypothetical protein